ncbi:hypothetical protein OIU83_22645 [Flavobacterium sp. LS1R49]|uniref:Tetratricopeptide repeat-containing protein n=1 Tax=Flavobacterium shii TaxID=2987687 RepID=A0A9X3C709_9FLAO|nr:DUF6624 domain-containing protein [Flavobacterium shii]MCV9930477.1 hypothetical protein [Flavobacterium shii]
MKKINAIFLFLLGINSLQAQTYKDNVQKADSCYNRKDFKTSVEYYEKAFKLEHTNPSQLYNGACSAALSNNTKKAFDWLNLAIDNGYKNLNHLEKDSDLATLHPEKEWQKTIIKLQKKLDIIETNYDKPLQKELIAIYEDDQNIRKEFMTIYRRPNYDKKKIDSIGKIINYKDSLNLIKISEILDKKGWIGENVIGSQANQTLFLVIQHSDLKTQQKYLPMMRDAVKKGNAKASSLALLEDRIALREGRKQIYGSQLAKNPATNKQYISPLEDPDNVDKRRAEVGLGTIAEYAQKWGIVWDVEAYKKELPELEKLEKK